MDPRLVPLNGLLALLRGDGGWPSCLRDQGFALSLLEAPVITSKGNLRADAVIYRHEPAVVLLCECKSGKNVEEEQAARYLDADAAGLSRTGIVPAALRGADYVVAALFVGRESERASLEASLSHLGLAAPLLTVGSDRVRLSGASAIDGLDDFDVRHAGGEPPGRIRVDHQSPSEEIRELVLQQIVAAQARRADFILTATLCEAVLPEWPVLSHSAQSDFIRRAEQALRALAASDLRSDIRFEPATHGTRSRTAILRSPATYDPRGATQGWQGLEKRGAHALRRARVEQSPGQMSLEDLAGTGGLSEE